MASKTPQGIKAWLCRFCMAIFPSDEWLSKHEEYHIQLKDSRGESHQQPLYNGGYGDSESLNKTKNDIEQFLCELDERNLRADDNFIQDTKPKPNTDNLLTVSNESFSLKEISTQDLSRIDGNTFRTPDWIQSPQSASALPDCTAGAYSVTCADDVNTWRTTSAASLDERMEHDDEVHSVESLDRFPNSEYVATDAGKGSSIRLENTYIRVEPYSFQELENSTDQGPEVQVPQRTHTSEILHCCSVCNYETVLAEDLKHHMKDHTEENNMISGSGGIEAHTCMDVLHSCHICGFKAGSPAALERHVINHSLERPDHTATSEQWIDERTDKGKRKFSCTVCEYTNTRWAVMKLHMRTHKDERPYNIGKRIDSGPVCEYTTVSLKTLRVQLERSFSCYKCPFKSISSDDMIDHLKTHAGEKNVRTRRGIRNCSCTVCGYTTIHPMSLKVHMRTHTGHKPFRCNKCTFRSNSSRDLLHHKKTHTLEIKNCTMCEYTTVYANAFEIHMRRHEGKNSLKCDKCNHESINYKAYLLHKKTHSIQRNYSCTKCEYTTARPNSLRTHMRSHNIVSSFSCEKCAYTSSSSNDLSVHMKSHAAGGDGGQSAHAQPLKIDERTPGENLTGERRFRCNKCSFRSISSRGLKYHKKRIHILKENSTLSEYKYVKTLNVDTKGHREELPLRCKVCALLVENCLLNHEDTDIEETDNEENHIKERKYSCTVCKYTTPYARRWKNHMQAHTGFSLNSKKLLPAKKTLRQYRCKKCYFIATSSVHLARHKKTHDVSRGYRCSKCTFRSTIARDVLLHMKTHRVVYSCTVCEYTTDHPYTLKVHKRTHTGERPYSCDKCDYRFISRRDLALHKKTHIGQPNYSCTMCNYKTVFPISLELHMQTHKGEKPFSCNKCAYRTTTHNELLLHIKIHIKKRTCTKCEYTTRYAKTMKVHMRSHKLERSFNCNKYAYTSSSSKDLSVHKKIHTGEKDGSQSSFGQPIEIDIEARSDPVYEPNTAGPNTARVHVGSHDLERSFSCDKCAYTSSSSNDLSVHMKTHTGEKDGSYRQPIEYTATGPNTARVHVGSHDLERSFSCDKCAYTSSSSNDLSVHMKTHTGEKDGSYRQPIEIDIEAPWGERNYSNPIYEYTAASPNTVRGQERSHNIVSSFRYDKCAYTSSNSDDLSAHMNTHIGQKDWCQDAYGQPIEIDIEAPSNPPYEYTATGPNTARVHVRSHNVVSSFSCDKCAFTSSSSDDLSVHMRTHTGEKDWSQGAYGQPIEIDIEAPRGEKDYSNPVNDYTAAGPNTARVQVGSHDLEGSFSCDKCAYRSRSTDDLKIHMKTHRGKKDWCWDAYGLPIEIGIEAPSNPPYEYTATSLNTARVHVRSHNVVSSFSCDKCAYTSSSSKDLSVHMRTHTGEKDWIESAYGQPLVIDIEAPRVERNYSNPIYEYTAASPNTWRTHVRRHSTEVPFRSDKCAYTSSSPDDLSVHMKTHRGEEDGGQSTYGQPIKIDIEAPSNPVNEYTATGPNTARVHVGSHKVQGSLSCVKCAYTSSSSDDLSVHMKTHTGPKDWSQDAYGPPIEIDIEVPSNPPYEYTTTGPNTARVHEGSHKVQGSSVHMKTHTGPKDWSQDAYGPPIEIDIEVPSNPPYEYTTTGPNTARVHEGSHKVQGSSVHMKTHTGPKDWSQDAYGLPIEIDKEAPSNPPYEYTTTGPNTARVHEGSHKVQGSSVHMKTHTGPKDWSQDAYGLPIEIDIEVPSNPPYEYTTTGPNTARVHEGSHKVQGSSVHMKTHTGQKDGSQSAFGQPIEIDIEAPNNPVYEYTAAGPNTARVQVGSHDLEGSFSCDKCAYRSSSSNDLSVHMKTHTGDKDGSQSAYGQPIEIDIEKPRKLFTCNECEFGALSSRGLKCHKKRIHILKENSTHTEKKDEHQSANALTLEMNDNAPTGKRNYSCPICKYTTTHVSMFKVHLKNHLLKKPCNCRKCVSISAEELSPPERPPEAEKNYTCSNCGYCSTQVRDMKEHLKTHTWRREYSCTECKYNTSNLKSFKSHMKTHTDPGAFNCTICGEIYIKKKMLKKHMDNHILNQPYSCKVSESETHVADVMEISIETHKTMKNVICTNCGDSVFSDGNLEGHICKHPEDMAPTCGFSMGSAGSSKEHMGTVSVEKPETQSVETLETQLVAKPETQSVVKLQTQSVKKPETQSVEKPETQTVETLERQSVERLDTQSVEKPETHSVEKLETYSIEKLETQSVEKPESQSDEKPETQTVETLERQSVETLETQSVVKLQTQSVEKPETQSVEKPETQTVETLERQSVERLDTQSVEKPETHSVEKLETQSVEKPESSLLNRHGTVENSYNCVGCDYHATSVNELRAHLQTHISVRYYSCSQCLYQTTYAANFKIHMKKHIDMKPLGCRICGSGFKHEARLRKHMRCHMFLKPTKCIKPNS